VILRNGDCKFKLANKETLSNEPVAAGDSQKWGL